jgi:hypothetical protein
MTLSARLGGVVEGDVPNEIVKRALAYPHAAPERSFVLVGTRATEVPEGGADLNGRIPLLAYGANAAPAALARKLAGLAEEPLPVLRAELADHDVVYSAHLSFHGAVPANLQESPGTVAPVFVAHPNEEQLAAITASEPNYELVQMGSLGCRLEDGGEIAEIAAYLSRHGPLSLGGSPVALAAVESAGRHLPEMTEPQMLELVRSQLAPELSLEAFILRCVESGGLAPLPTLTPL